MQTATSLSAPLSRTELVDLFLSFSKEIGIPLIPQTLTKNEQLLGLKAEHGCICYDLDKIQYPGDILKLTARMAICTPQIRSQLMGAGIENDNLKEKREIAALLWVYAACNKLNVDVNIVLQNDKTKGETEWYFDNFNRRNYIGLSLLCSMQLAEKESFPTMKGWLRSQGQINN